MRSWPPIPTASVIGFLGLELPDGRTMESAQRQQADELNADWIHKFKTR